MNDGRVDKLYDRLSRYQWFMRRLRRGGSGGLEMHKRLRAGAGGDLPGEGRAALNDWLWDLVEDRFEAAPRVLDVGCGFGATLLSWAGRADCPAGGRFVGLTLSGYQAGKARDEAMRRGRGDGCSFVQQSFDEPVDGPFAGRFDVVVSVETLFHAADLERTLCGLAPVVRAGGAIVLVEDMGVDDSVRSDPVARALLDRWATAELKTVDDYRSGLAAAGFAIDREIDLTPQVDVPDRVSRDRRERRLRTLRRFSPFGRRVVDAFLGGIAMERLYAAGLLEYRTVLATRRE